MKANNRTKSGFSGGILASLDNPVDVSFKDVCSSITNTPYASDDDCSSGNQETHSRQSNGCGPNGSSEGTDSTASKPRNDNPLPKFVYPTQLQDAADLSVLSWNHSMLLSTPTTKKPKTGRRSTTELNQSSESISDGSVNQNDEEEDDGTLSDSSAERISVKDELASSASSQPNYMEKKFGIQKDTFRKRSDSHEDRAKHADDLDSGEAEDTDENSRSDQFSSENEFLDSDEDEDDGSEEYVPDDGRRHGDDSFITDASDDELEIDDGLDDEEPEWTRSQTRLNSLGLDYDPRSENAQIDVNENGEDGSKSEALEEPSLSLSPGPSMFSPDLRGSPSLMDHDSRHCEINDSREEGVPLCDEDEEQAPQHDEHSKNGLQSIEVNKENRPNVLVLKRDSSPANSVHLQSENKKDYWKLTSSTEHEKDASVQCEGRQTSRRSDNTGDTGCGETLIRKEIFRSNDTHTNKPSYPPSPSSLGEKSANSSRSKMEANNADRDAETTNCNNENANIEQHRDGCDPLSLTLCSSWSKKDLASESVAPPKVLSEVADSLNRNNTEILRSLDIVEATTPSKKVPMSANNISPYSAVFNDNDTVDDDHFLPNQSPAARYESTPERTSAFLWDDEKTPRRISSSARPPKSTKLSQATGVHNVRNDDILPSESFARTAIGENSISDMATQLVDLSHASPIFSNENTEVTSSCKNASLKRATIVGNYNSSEDAEVNDDGSLSGEDDETEVEEEYRSEDDQTDEGNDTVSYAEDWQVSPAKFSGSIIDGIYNVDEHIISDKEGLAEAVVVEDNDTSSEIEVFAVVDDEEDADTVTDQSEGNCAKGFPTSSMERPTTDAKVNYNLQKSLNYQSKITTGAVTMPKDAIDHNESTHDCKDEKIASSAALFEHLGGSIVLQNISNKQGRKIESIRWQRAGFGIQESNAPTEDDRKSSYRRDRGSLVKRGKWTLGSQIGRGSFGVVRMGMNKETGTLMAVKVIDCDRLVMKDIRREIELLKYLGHHPNVVKYFGAEMDQSLYIFQEWVPGGSITNMLSKFGPFSFPVVRIYLKQVLAGLAYLHDNRILHRDIKGSNILVNDEGIVKLADFGASRQVQELQGGMLMTMTMRGTPYFMAPEVFEEKYGYASDIWSVGCVAIQMVTGLPPWKDLGINNPVRLYNHIKKWHGPPPLHWKEFETYNREDVLRPFLDKCFLKKPGDRPCALELLKEPFFLELKSELFDEQTATPRSLFSVEDDQSLFGWEHILSPATQHSAHTPGKDGRLRRCKSTGLLRSPFLSPPIPRQCDVKKELTVVESPQYDTSDWPSWARKNVRSSKKQITESPVIDEASKLMGSLAISDDSSTNASANLWRRNLFCKSTFSTELSEGSTLVGEGLIGSDSSQLK